MTHDEEVDKIIDILSDNLWHFIMNREMKNGNLVFITHLFKPNENCITTTSLCQELSFKTLELTSDCIKENYFISMDSMCDICLSKIQTNPEKYGFAIKNDSFDYFHYKRITL